MSMWNWTDPFCQLEYCSELYLFQYRHLTYLPIYTKMMNTGNNAPTNATQTKERLYAQLALSLGRMSRAVSQTADLCEQLQVDLHAMRILGGLDAAKYVVFVTYIYTFGGRGFRELITDYPFFLSFFCI